MGVEWFAVNVEKREAYDLHKVGWADFGLLDVQEFLDSPADEGDRHWHVYYWLRAVVLGPWKGDTVVLVNDCSWPYAEEGIVLPDGRHIPPLWTIEAKQSGWTVWCDWLNGSSPNLLRGTPLWPYDGDRLIRPDSEQ